MSRQFSLAKNLVFLLFFVAIGCFSGRAVFAATLSKIRPTVIPNDLFWNRQWYLRQISMPEAWAMTTGSRNMIVAVIDGGVDINHQDLRENIWTNDREIPNDGLDNDQDGFVDDVHGWNFVSGSSDVGPVRQERQFEEAWSHGTAVASLIGAKGNDGRGIAGVAWNVRLMPLVILDANGSGSSDHLVQAIRYAVNHGAKVINLSLFSSEPDPDAEEMIRRATNAGVSVVIATGNSVHERGGVNLDEYPVYPVCQYDEGPRAWIGVGGTDPLDQKAPYANYGSACTDLSAPGMDLFAARPSYPHDTKPTSTVPGFVEKLTGTSVAAPLVSGTIALMRSLHPEWTVTEVRDRLVAATDPIEDMLAPVERGNMGSGRLNVARALRSDYVPLRALATKVMTRAVTLPPLFVTIMTKF